MKNTLLTFVFIFSCCTFSYAQYNIYGKHFEDTLKIISTVTTAPQKIHKVIFDAPTDETYIYHMVAEGESIESILNMYQLCAPCFASWNNYTYTDFYSLKREQLYAGEYLKVALKKDYYEGFPSNSFTKYEYATLTERISLYNISRRYGISQQELRKWNNFNEYLYNVEGGTKIIVAKNVYKYVCPCKNR